MVQARVGQVLGNGETTDEIMKLSFCLCAAAALLCGCNSKTNARIDDLERHLKEQQERIDVLSIAASEHEQQISNTAVVLIQSAELYSNVEVLLRRLGENSTIEDIRYKDLTNRLAHSIRTFPPMGLIERQAIEILQGQTNTPSSITDN